jgi:hypothetical protein
MNEHELQIILRNDWTENKFNFNSSLYELICWELMFPSWEINNNKGKFNEPSIDFIFYSEEKSEFLCVELKNEIKNRGELLSGFCQVAYSASQFKKQYSIDKIKNAQSSCFNELERESGKKVKNFLNIEFSESPKIKRILLAKKFPMNPKTDEYFNLFNSFNLNDLNSEVLNYSDKYNPPLKRIKLINKEDFHLISEFECYKVRID